MMHVKYKLGRSSHHGTGLFADQEIRKGQLIYTASPLLDVNISNEQFESLEENEKKEIRYWGYWIEKEKVWHVDFDVSKFLNHSLESNVTQDSAKESAHLVAMREIKAGEELTQNYLEFESEEALKRRGVDFK